MENLMLYKGVYGSVEFCGKSEVFHGKILGLSKGNYVSYEGDSVESLQCDFRDAVEDYIEFCAEKGIELPIYENGQVNYVRNYVGE
jgi:predicted HicB family RNase H-like nuclease